MPNPVRNSKTNEEATSRFFIMDLLPCLAGLRADEFTIDADLELEVVWNSTEIGRNVFYMVANLLKKQEFFEV